MMEGWSGGLEELWNGLWKHSWRQVNTGDGIGAENCICKTTTNNVNRNALNKKYLIFKIIKFWEHINYNTYKYF